MRGLAAFVLMLALAGCGDDATPLADSGPGDAGPGFDAGPGGDAGPGFDAGPGGDAGPGFDAGPVADLDACFDGIAPTDGGFVQIQDLLNDDGSIHVRLATEPGDRMAIGETFPYDLVRFGITRDGVTTCITDPAQLAYEFGHHNWNELATATTATDVYEVHMVLDIVGDPPGWTDTLTISDPGSTTPREGPIPMHDGGCRSVPFDPNPCLMRMRTDV